MDTITNYFDLNYDYKIDPSGSASTKSLESNTVSTNLILGSLNMIKTVDKNFATIGDILNYTVTISNNGNILVTNVIFKDLLPDGASFVPSSVSVDGTSEPTSDITSGFSIGNMIIGATKTVTFQATIDFLPTPNTITNKASTTFDYLVVGVVTGNAESNSVITTINVTDVSLVKSSDVENVESGDTITYTNTITNNGNIAATNMIFTDTLSDKVTFISESVIVNSVSEPTYNPNTGFNIGSIEPGTTATIIFKVTVN